MEEIMMAMLAGGHALLVGVPGLAKTLMIRSIAEAMRLEFRRIQFTPYLVPSETSPGRPARRHRRTPRDAARADRRAAAVGSPTGED